MRAKWDRPLVNAGEMDDFSAELTFMTAPRMPFVLSRSSPPREEKKLVEDELRLPLLACPVVAVAVAGGAAACGAGLVFLPKR